MKVLRNSKLSAKVFKRIGYLDHGDGLTTLTIRDLIPMKSTFYLVYNKKGRLKYKDSLVDAIVQKFVALLSFGLFTFVF